MVDFDIYKISNLESRKYFNEVLQAFYSENYNASVLLLYNLLINDIYNKLQLMKENGLLELNDWSELLDKLKEIDDDIEKIANCNQKKPNITYNTIEHTLFTTYVSNKLFSKDTILMLNYLKEIRNKCAHPCFAGEYKYYSPEKEVCSMFITKSYNDILVVDAYFKNFNSVVDKILDNKIFDELENNIFVDIETKNKKNKELYLYYEENFFNKLTDTHFITLFKYLTDKIFNDIDEKNSIKIQFRRYTLLKSSLKFLFKKGKINILEKQYNWENVDREKIYDEEAHELYKNKNLTYMFTILNIHKVFATEIKNDNKLLFMYLKEKLDKNAKYLIKYFEIFYHSIGEAIDEKRIAIDEKEKIIKYYKIILDEIIQSKSINKIDDSSLIKLLTILFKKIPDFRGFDDADAMCDALIEVIKEKKYKTDKISDILEIMNKNDQIYRKNREKRDGQFEKLVELGIQLFNYDNLN